MATELLILGLGNLLCRDDGLGVEAVERLRREYRIPEGVRVLDGGTLGLALAGYFERACDALLVDAVRTGKPAGTLVRLSGPALGTAVRERLSAHQVGVADLLDGLRLTGLYPRNLLLLGLEPASLELGLGLSPEVEAALPRLLEAVVREARHLGHELRREERHAEGTTGDPVRGAGSRLALAGRGL